METQILYFHFAVWVGVGFCEFLKLSLSQVTLRYSLAAPIFMTHFFNRETPILPPARSAAPYTLQGGMAGGTGCAEQNNHVRRSI